MLITSPPDLHYPITVTELLVSRNDHVTKSAPLFIYFYKSKVVEGNRYGEEFEVEKTFPTRFQSETEGRLVNWKIARGSVIESAGVELVEIEEPCRHDVQYGGMCVACGQDMTEVDYTTSRPHIARANVSLPYVTDELRFTQNGAAQGEDAVKRRLLQVRKLSLVVDLDQTIIHASVEETIGEWQADPSSPNHEALKDVRNFQLDDFQRPDKKLTYYIKLRPGLFDFLERVSRIYEMHVYTMGTREYALNILRIVDPDGKLFGDRIISRDESKSTDFKNIRQMFPVDTKMVLIIDDRGDVWSWADNLVKVKPYNFFVGAGDINGMFLPKRQDTVDVPPASLPPATPETAPDPRKDQEESATIDEPAPNSEAEFPVQSNPPVNASNLTSVQDQILMMNGGANDTTSLEEKIAQQNEAITAQIEDRPLLQKQKMLDKAEEDAAVAQANATDSHPHSSNDVAVADVDAAAADDDGAPSSLSERQSQGQQQFHNRRQLFQDDDVQLYWLEKHLQHMHQIFFEAYSRNKLNAQGGRVAELSGKRSPKKRPEDDLVIVPDIKEIVTPMRKGILDGVNMTFTGVFKKPKNVDPNYVFAQDWAQWAVFCGAVISLEVHKYTTHVIADASRRTALVRQAERNRKVKIVAFSWLVDCLFQWKHVEEKPYLIEFEPDRDSGAAAYGSPLDELEEGKLSPGDTPEDSSTLPSDNEDGWIVNGEEKPSLSLDTAMDGIKEGDSDAEGEDEKGKEKDEAEDGEDGAEEAISPIEKMNEVAPADWDAMEAELAELSSDSEDDENASDYASDVTEENKPASQRKRKRTASSQSSVDGSSDDGHEGGSNGLTGAANGHDEPNSRLQQRKRRAFARTSSLTNMLSSGAADDNHADANDMAMDRTDDADDYEDGKEQEKHDDDDEDEGEEEQDDLEKELEAQLDNLSNGDFGDDYD